MCIRISWDWDESQSCVSKSPGVGMKVSHVYPNLLGLV